MAKKKKVDFNLASEVFEDASLTDTFQKEPIQKTVVKLENLKTNPYQPRIQMDKDHIQELANSIEQNGLLQPITVLNNHDDTFTIVFGHRRAAAYEYLGKDEIEANILNSIENNNLVISPIVENLQRKDMEPIETAMALNKVIKMGVSKTQEDLAKLLGISQSRISKLLTILKLNDDLLDSISKKGYKDVTVLAALNKVPTQEQLQIFDKIQFLSRSEALKTIKKSLSKNDIVVKRVVKGNNSIKVNTKGLDDETKEKVYSYIQQIENILN
jgi:ParB family chromosome partitioning protein